MALVRRLLKVMIKVSILILRSVGLIGVLSLLGVVQTKADPITYSFTGTGTGTFGGMAFTNASFTISVYADTTNVQVSGGLYVMAGTTSAIGVTGIGLGIFTNPKQVFRQSTYLGFAQFNGFDLLDISHSSFSNYGLTNSFGPIVNLAPQPGTLAINEPTTFGVISFVSFGNISFTASTGNFAPPQILTQPTNQIVLAGDSTNFNAVASGAIPMAFYWQQNSTNLPGSSNPLLLTNIQAGSAGDYLVVVTNAFGSVTSQVATLTVIPSPPRFTLQPISAVALFGSNVRFTAAANGSSPLDWQWYFNGSPVDGGNSSQLVITNIQNSNFGNYWAIVTNSYGCATSTVVTLNYSPVVVWGDNSAGQTNISASATNAIALAGGDYHVLALTTNGTVVGWGNNNAGQSVLPSDLTNVVSIAAGSSHSLALRSDGTVTAKGVFIGTSSQIIVPAEATNVVALALGPGAQHALVLRSDGTVVDWGRTNEPLLQVIPPTAKNIVSVAAGSHHCIALRSDGKVVAWGYNNNGINVLPVPASATNIVAIATGWYANVALRANGTILAWGSISSPLTSSGFTNVIDLACPFNSFFGDASILALRRDGKLVITSGSVPANATNIVAVGAASNNGLALVGSGRPVFSGIPVNRTVVGGATAYMRLMAVGAFPLSYQWSCNGTPIAGATNTVIAVTNVQPNQAGSYYTLTASNSLGMATRGPITLNAIPLEFSIQPPSLSISMGATAKFTVTNSVGQGAFSYQWQFNNANIDGATNISLSLTNVQLNQTGTYSAIVGNTYGNVTNNAALTVQPFVFNAISTNLLMTTNGLRFQLDSVFATQSVVIFASSDLVSWLPILTNPPATGSVMFLDSSATNLPQRFYRATEQ